MKRVRVRERGMLDDVAVERFSRRRARRMTTGSFISSAVQVVELSRQPGFEVEVVASSRAWPDCLFRCWRSDGTSLQALCGATRPSPVGHQCPDRRPHRRIHCRSRRSGPASSLKTVRVSRAARPAAASTRWRAGCLEQVDKIGDSLQCQNASHVRCNGRD